MTTERAEEIVAQRLQGLAAYREAFRDKVDGLTDLEAAELMAEDAKRVGMLPYEFGWHLSAANEDELADLQADHLADVARAMMIDPADYFVAYGINRKKLGYGFRVEARVC